jgi:hypothetical protein
MMGERDCPKNGLRVLDPFVPPITISTARGPKDIHPALRCLGLRPRADALGVGSGTGRFRLFSRKKERYIYISIYIYIYILTNTEYVGKT